MKTHFKNIEFYFRADLPEANFQFAKLHQLIKKNYQSVKILESNSLPRVRKYAPHLLIILGGDGTILEAAQKFQRWNPLVLGLNMGHVGFLASVRDKKQFSTGLSSVLKGKYKMLSRMLIKATLIRKGRKIFSTYALNDIAVQNLFGIVDLSVRVENHPVQSIHGTGVLVATATGSTAYNLSAHGPIVMPDIKCLIITELMDHNIPTPSLIIKRNKTVEIRVLDFREMKPFIIRRTGEPADVVLIADKDTIVPLKKGDRVVIRKSERLVRFAELEKNYFFKSLQDKFAFK